MPPIDVLSLDRIIESPTNVRRRFDEQKLGELAASIEKKGVRVPLRVRPKDGAYELVDGHRRFRASTRVGLAEVPVIIEELSDEAALEEQLVANGQREDLHPLDEADGYRALAEKYGHSIESIAGRQGKSVSHIYQRMRLCSLCDEAREAFLSGALNASIALMIARIPVAELQQKALEQIVDRRFGDSMTVEEARDHIRRNFMLRLETAPFDRSDGDLVPGAWPCTTCRKRTGCQTELFADVGSDDLCTDPTCFEAKADASWRARVAKAAETGQRVLDEREAKRVFPYGSTPSYGSDYVDVAQTVYRGADGLPLAEVLGAKLPQTVLARDSTGQVHELLPRAEAAKALRSVGVKPPPELAARPVVDKAKTKLEDEKAAQATKLREATYVATLTAVLAAVVKKGVGDSVLRVLCSWLFGSIFDDTALHAVLARHGVEVDPSAIDAALDKAFEARLPKLKANALAALLVDLIMELSEGEHGDAAKRLDKLCELYRVDTKAIAAEVRAREKAAAAGNAPARKGAKPKNDNAAKEARS